MKVTVISQDSTTYKGDLTNKQITEFVKACVVDLRQETKRIIPDISVIFVSSTKIAALNKKYRDIDTPTDVLSFASEEDGYLGDIIIAKEVVESYAQKNEVIFAEELKRDILHGIMHLLGFEHTKDLVEGKHEKMFILQEKILQKYI
jgi:probable rRNA maturation factor